MSHPEYVNTGNPATRVIEECAELTQALCKVDRFGWFSCHPERLTFTNMDDVRSEIDDVIEALNRLDVYMRELSAAKEEEVHCGRTITITTIGGHYEQSGQNTE